MFEHEGAHITPQASPPFKAQQRHPRKGAKKRARPPLHGSPGPTNTSLGSTPMRHPQVQCFNMLSQVTLQSEQWRAITIACIGASLLHSLVLTCC